MYMVAQRWEMHVFSKCIPENENYNIRVYKSNERMRLIFVL